MNPEWVAGRPNGPPGLTIKVESTNASTQPIPWLRQRGVGHLGTARDPIARHPPGGFVGRRTGARQTRSVLKMKRVDPAHPCISAAMGIGDADPALGQGIGIGDEVRPRA